MKKILFSLLLFSVLWAQRSMDFQNYEYVKVDTAKATQMTASTVGCYLSQVIAANPDSQTVFIRIWDTGSAASYSTDTDMTLPIAAADTNLVGDLDWGISVYNFPEPGVPFDDGIRWCVMQSPDSSAPPDSACIVHFILYKED